MSSGSVGGILGTENGGGGGGRGSCIRAFVPGPLTGDFIGEARGDSTSSSMDDKGGGPVPSTASLMRDIVLSMLRLLVLGLVLVVPKLCWRECPRRNIPLPGVLGEIGDGGVDADGEDGNTGDDNDGTSSWREIASSIPFDKGESTGEEAPDTDCDIMFLASSDSGSTRSGGSRSFSISDLRL